MEIVADRGSRLYLIMLARRSWRNKTQATDEYDIYQNKRHAVTNEEEEFHFYRYYNNTRNGITYLSLFDNPDSMILIR